MCMRVGESQSCAGIDPVHLLYQHAKLLGHELCNHSTISQRLTPCFSTGMPYPTFTYRDHLWHSARSSIISA